MYESATGLTLKERIEDREGLAFDRYADTQLVVGQVQGQIVGQEVTDASARIEAVFDVLDAIVVLLLVEARLQLRLGLVPERRKK
jgi:hypothetical protein